GPDRHCARFGKHPAVPTRPRAVQAEGGEHCTTPGHRSTAKPGRRAVNGSFRITPWMNPAQGEIYICLMSGTSLDGVDGVLMDLGSPPPWRTLAHVHRAFEPDLRRTLLALNTPDTNELHSAAMASQALVRTCAQVVNQVCSLAGMTPAQIRAI